MTIALQKSQDRCSGVIDKDAGTGVLDGGTASLPLKRGGVTGAQVPLHNSIVGNFRDTGAVPSP